MIQLIKSALSENLSHNNLKKLRDISYNISYPPSSYSQLAERLVLILGCQRSGNTLTYLMLNAHPSIHGIDESDVDYKFPTPSSLKELKTDPKSLFTLKFPAQTAKIEYILKYLAESKIIWPSRNPYAVVSSMLRWQQKEGNWIKVYGANELWQHSFIFPEILDIDIESLDEVSLGAYIWKYKELTLNWCRQNNLAVYDFQYEKLLDDPAKIMAEIVEFIGLEWDESVLNHENQYSSDKRYPGGTDGSKAIDKSRKKPKLALSEEDFEVIANICGEEMKPYDYQVP